MATGKQGFVRAGVPQHSVPAQREGETCVQAPLTAMYIQTLPGLPVPVMCANPAMPLLTLQVSSRMTEQQQRPEVAAASLRPKAAGKHVCLHCGRDCLKPSVLEKHLRCHTGERPYPCTTCGISFKTQSNLYKHKRTQAHARLSSESGKSTLSSQESTDSSRETCSSPPLELQSDDLADGDGGDGGAATSTKTVLGHADPRGRAVLQTDWALGKAAAGLDASPAQGQQESLSPAGQRGQLSSKDVTESSSMQMESPTRAPSTPNRTPLQRQKALFPTLSRGKTQSHGSTDSGFSEGSEPNFTSSPGASLHDPSMESVAESNMELQEPGSSRTLSGVTHEDDKSKVSVQEKQKLEEHILKLISDNSMLMDDRHLLNVRPRKTVLSKQGSIDLPMPYTYKDSFHFEMRSSKHQDSSSPKQDRRGRAIYSSVPTQYSASLEHAPLTRSSSLPFSVGTQNSERTASPCPGGSVPLSRRCSAGNICTFTSVDQHPPGHRLLVRQAAVDCLPGMEATPNHSSLSSDGDCTDAAVESAAKKWRRKKGQKFAYSKWYMYGGGTFKKLYDTETSVAQKSRMPPPSMEPAQSQGIQTSQQRESSSAVSSCSAACLPPAVNVLPVQTHSQVISSYVLLQSQLINQTAPPLQPGLANQNAAPSTDLNHETGGVKGTEEKSQGLEMQLSSLIPPERKKQKTVDDHSALIEKTDTLINQRCLFASGSRQLNLNVCDVTDQSSQPACADLFQRSSASELQKDSRLNLHRQGSLTSSPPSNQRQLVFKRHSSPLFVVSKSGRSGCPSVSSVTSPTPQAKQSFLPMYQLKIPCFTDGASDSHHRNAPSPKLPSSSHTPAQQGACETSSLSVPQSQPAAGVVSRGQEQQGTVTKPLASPVCKEQNANALTKAEALHQPSSYLSVISATPTLVSSTSQSGPGNTLVQNQSTLNMIHNMPAGSVSSVLSHPVQTFTPLGHSQSVTVSTTHSTISLLSHSSTATKTSQTHTATAASAERSSTATSVAIFKKPLDTHIPVSQSSMDSDPLGINQSELQESKSEDKTLLVNDSLQSLTQGMFYVRTADLQIFMQLISDEQLALIEPQIETQDFKLPGSHSFPHQDSETLQPNTAQTSISQEIHKQCSDNTITKPGVSESDINNSASSKILDRISLSDVATEQQNITESAKDANSRCPENIDLKTGPQGVISSSKTANCTSAPLDSKTNPLGQQCKSHHVSVVSKDLESAGCIITVRSHPDQSPGEPLGGVSLADESTAKQGSGPMPRSSPTLESSILCVSAVREGEQDCRVTVSHPGAVNTSVASLSRPGESTEKTPMSLKEKTPFCPDIPVLSDKCQLENCQAALTTTGQHESSYPPAGKSESVAGEAAGADAEAKAEVSCVQEDLLLPPASLSLTVSRQKELLCAAQPSQHELCQSALTTPVTEDCGSAWVPTLRQHKSSNQSGACGGDECDPTYEARGNETCSPVQAPGQHLPQQDPCSQREDVMWNDGKQGTVQTARTARVSPGRRAPNRTPEERVKCGGSTGGIGPANQDPDTGRWLCGLTQNLQLNWEAEMGFMGWAPLEHKTGKEENKKEETPGTPEGEQSSSRKPHPHLSQQVTNAHDCTPASCGTTSLSHHVPAPCQRESNPLINSEQVRDSGGASSKAMQELIIASVAKDSDRVPLGCHKRLTSSPAGHLTSTCGHSPSESVIQKEVQKESHVKNTASQSHSKSSHLSEHKRRGTTEFSVSAEPCVTLSPCNTATSGAINIMPADPNCPSPNPANSYAIPSKLTCISTAHSNCAEPHASQCHLSGSYLEEEGTSSSSDDEGKLVIELE